MATTAIRRPKDHPAEHQNVQPGRQYKMRQKPQSDVPGRKGSGKLRNKIAIVTGGGSGIGLAIAEKFIQQNITTIIVGRDKQKLENALDKFGSLCVPFCFLHLFFVWL